MDFKKVQFFPEVEGNFFPLQVEIFFHFKWKFFSTSSFKKVQFFPEVEGKFFPLPLNKD